MSATNTLPISPALAEALALHQHGRLQEAEARYAKILAGDPGNVAARYHQALARLQRGDLEDGMAALKQLLKRAPDHVEANFNLGRAYLECGKAAKALAHFQRVAALSPNVAEGHFYLGLALVQLDRHAEAVPPFERAIALRTDLPEAHLNLGSVLNETGRYEAALAHFERALALRPGIAEAHNGLGNALLGLGRTDEAAQHFRQAIALRADYAEPYQGLGMVLNKLGRYHEAAQQFKQTIILKPDFVEAFAGWGHALHEMGQGKAARACWEKVIELEPKRAEAYVGLGLELKDEGEYVQALARFEHALSLEPANPYACNSLGGLLFTLGRGAEGLFYLRRAIEMAPKVPEYHSGLLFNLHYHPGEDAAEVSARHRAFGEHFEAPLKVWWQLHTNAPDPDRPLRVGFVSGDFKSHPVGYFMADLLTSLKAAGLELYAYANQWVSDDLTKLIRPQFTMWKECKALSDEALAAQIRADGIDILVDLSGHTADNRLLVFASKPAPVQVTYLGYFDTTGLTAMDYILGNRWLLPEAESHLYTERAWWLPDAHLCFTPPDLPVEVGPLPTQHSGYIVFGCFNKTEKVNSQVMACWARLLLAVPGSRLYLKNKPFGDPVIAEHYRHMFMEHGIGAERLILEGESGYREYLESYNRVDIALDPFPYNGGTTTVEAIWMGVPTLALRGDRYVAHMGESILHTMGMPEWIASDEADYVAKAVALAGDLPALAAMRAGLRERLLASPICDAPRFARNLEEAFRGMWRAWCKG